MEKTAAKRTTKKVIEIKKHPAILTTPSSNKIKKLEPEIQVLRMVIHSIRKIKVSTDLNKPEDVKIRKSLLETARKIEGKKDKKFETWVEESQKLTRIDEKAISLINELDDSYTKSSIIYAALDSSSDLVFPNAYRKMEQNNEPDAFLAFSAKTLDNLAQLISNATAAKGGFLVYADYTIENQHYLSVFLIRDTKGKYFTNSKGEPFFKISELEHLDLARLAMACRIDVNCFRKKNKQNYMSVISKHNDISEYFIRWIGAVNKESNVNYTNDLLQILNLAAKPKDKLGKEMEPEAFREAVFNYYKTLPQKVIDLNELSKTFYDDEKYLPILAATQNILINTQFTPDKATMTKFVRVDVDSDDINLRFPRSAITNKKIRIVNHQVIIDSPIFTQDLQKELANVPVGKTANPAKNP